MSSYQTSFRWALTLSLVTGYSSPHKRALAQAPTTTSRTTGMELVLIPAGVLEMGTSQSEPGKRDNEPEGIFVEISRPFYLGKSEVTVSQFRQFTSATRYQAESLKGNGSYAWDAAANSWVKSTSANWKNPGYAQGDEHPVVCVSWNDATAFCQWLSRQDGATYRLPTEAEWEYSCRAGTETRFHTGEQLFGTQANVHSCDPERTREIHLGQTCTVSSYPPNAFGLHDMHGNVQEWCHDWYGGKGYFDESPRKDPLGPTTGKERVLRGGSWNNLPEDARASRRLGVLPTGCLSNTGFRVVRVAQ